MVKDIIQAFNECRLRYIQTNKRYKLHFQVVHAWKDIQLPGERVLKLESDYVLLAAGIIITACYALHGAIVAEEVTMEYKKRSTYFYR